MEDRQFQVLKALIEHQPDPISITEHGESHDHRFHVIRWTELPKGEWRMEMNEAIFFGDQLHSVRTYRELIEPMY